MAKNKSQSKTKVLETKKIERLRPRKRPGRHAKRGHPEKQTFFTGGACR